MKSVQVEIFGQLYNLKGLEEDDYIRELAAYLDTKMKEVQKGTGTADPHRLAILTALTISDELYKVRKEFGALENMTKNRIKKLLQMTDAPAS